jgi:hypothetical protein
MYGIQFILESFSVRKESSAVECLKTPGKNSKIQGHAFLIYVRCVSGMSTVIRRNNEIRNGSEESDSGGQMVKRTSIRYIEYKIVF